MGNIIHKWAVFIGIVSALALPSLSYAMANPAAVNCAKQSGKSMALSDSQGNQYAMCVFKDLSYCEEWALLRKECKAGQNTKIIEASGDKTKTPTSTSKAPPSGVVSYIDFNTQQSATKSEAKLTVKSAVKSVKKAKKKKKVKRKFVSTKPATTTATTPSNATPTLKLVPVTDADTPEPSATPAQQAMPDSNGASTAAQQATPDSSSVPTPIKTAPETQPK